MKLEKVNDNQIKCTLSREDLASRHLRISELAYGSPKARELFQDMMQQAQCELGFEADNLPLMIEAIPVSGECLVLIVTKVEEPEELDTRFSNFTSLSPRPELDPIEHAVPAYADEILSCFDHLEELLNKLGSDENKKEKKEQDIPVHRPHRPITEIKNVMTKIYVFNSFQKLRSLATMLNSVYSGKNTLYLDNNGLYLLVVHMSEHTPEEFNKVCNILSEYGRPAHTTYATSDFFEEHLRKLIANDAISQLAQI